MTKRLFSMPGSWHPRLHYDAYAFSKEGIPSSVLWCPATILSTDSNHYIRMIRVARNSGHRMNLLKLSFSFGLLTQFPDHELASVGFQVPLNSHYSGAARGHTTQFVPSEKTPHQSPLYSPTPPTCATTPSCAPSHTSFGP